VTEEQKRAVSALYARALQDWYVTDKSEIIPRKAIDEALSVALEYGAGQIELAIGLGQLKLVIE